MDLTREEKDQLASWKDNGFLDVKFEDIEAIEDDSYAGPERVRNLKNKLKSKNFKEKYPDFTHLYQLASLTESVFLGVFGFGRNTLNTLRVVLTSHDAHLGSTVASYLVQDSPAMNRAAQKEPGTDEQLSFQRKTPPEELEFSVELKAVYDLNAFQITAIEEGYLDITSVFQQVAELSTEFVKSKLIASFDGILKDGMDKLSEEEQEVVLKHLESKVTREENSITLSLKLTPIAHAAIQQHTKAGEPNILQKDKIREIIDQNIRANLFPS